MAIIIGSQFDLKATQFNFSRDYFESVELLNKAPITDFPDHFITNVAGTLYQLTKANGVWDDSKKTWTVSPWKKLEFGDKNALTTDGNGKVQKNGVDVNELTVTNGNTTVSIEAKSGETDGISVSSFNSGHPGTLILNGEGLRQSTGGSNTTVWTTDGGTVDISGLPSEGAVAAIQAKLAGIDDTVKGYVDSQVKGLASALVFKGSVSQGSDLPKNPKVGDTYVISAIGEYAGETCEVGDTIICTVAKSDETAAQWLVVQKNIDGALTRGDDKSWDGKLLVGAPFNRVCSITGSEGQLIKADAEGNPVYFTPEYASTDDVNALDERITTTATTLSAAAAAANEKAVNAAKKADDASGAAAAANRAAAAAQATADEAKQAGADASAKVDTAIAALNATVTSDDAAVAKVKVVEEGGKITDVVVTNFGAGVTHTAATESAEANLTATTATGAVVGSDIAKIKSYVDEKSTIVSISETEIADLLK